MLTRGLLATLKFRARQHAGISLSSWSLASRATLLVKPKKVYIMKRILLIVVLLCVAVSNVHAKDATKRTIPVPQSVSVELQTLIGA